MRISFSSDGWGDVGTMSLWSVFVIGWGSYYRVFHSDDCWESLVYNQPIETGRKQPTYIGK